MYDYTTRNYRDGDSSQIFRLFEQFEDELVQLDPLHRLRREAGYRATMLARTLDDIAQHEGIWYVAVDHEQIIAFAVATVQRPTQEEWLSLVRSSRGRVTELYVHPSYRRQGIATRLLHAIPRLSFRLTLLSKAAMMGRAVP